ncbi:hypothetical protein F5890DRAFT_1521718 [Lentinula detonsa]|uniref:Uncharacterized protein n=1 Tax=Lentinula detonsa TaxID=2804962 RepID=A0AA38PXW4_9AGAR|nr:hypothetical protein F5890DRAFT_1521718 [Lentinula detonsa]
MLHSFTSRFISILLLFNLAAVVIALPFCWLARDYAQTRDGRKTACTLNRRLMKNGNFTLPQPSTFKPNDNLMVRHGKGLVLLIIAQVKFDTWPKRDAILQELSTLEAHSNLLYLVKVVTAIRRMIEDDLKILNPAEKRITGFIWRNKLTWEEKYWRMIETYADGFGGVVEGQGKERYDVLLNARTQASKKGDNASTQSFT